MGGPTAKEIEKMLKNYSHPVMRKATVGDFLSEERGVIDTVYVDNKKKEKVVDNRLQKEYGERKRIKP